MTPRTERPLSTPGRWAECHTLAESSVHPNGTCYRSPATDKKQSWARTSPCPSPGQGGREEGSFPLGQGRAPRAAIACIAAQPHAHRAFPRLGSCAGSSSWTEHGPTLSLIQGEDPLPGPTAIWNKWVPKTEKKLERNVCSINFLVRLKELLGKDDRMCVCMSVRPPVPSPRGCEQVWETDGI